MKITLFKNEADIELTSTDHPLEFILSSLALSNDLFIEKIVVFDNPPVDGTVFPTDGAYLNLRICCQVSSVRTTIQDYDFEGITATADDFKKFKKASID